MRAHVYALVEARGQSFDLYAVWGTFQEALDHYIRIKGYTPTNVEKQTITNNTTGEQHDIWTLDKDDNGWAWISQYRLDVTEFV